MNKNGQTLILFVIMIPILLGLCAFVIDVGSIVLANTKLREVTKTIISDVMDDASIDKIQSLYLKNDIPVENLEVEIKEDEIRIQNEYEIDSIFGSIIGFDTYKVEVDIVGMKVNDKVIFE